MSAVVHLRQPAAVRGIDWTNRFARNLRMLRVGSAGPNDLVRGVSATAGSAASLVATRAGRAFRFDGSNNARWASSGFAYIVGNVGTYFVRASRFGFYDTNGMVLWGTNTTNSVFFQMPNGFQSAFCFGQQITSVDPALYTNTTDTTVVFTSNGLAAGKRIYINGISRGTPDANAPVAFAAGSKNFQFGAWIGGTTWDVDADIELDGFANEVWNADDVMEFHRNGNQMLLPEDEGIEHLFPQAAATTFNAAWNVAANSVIQQGALAA